MIIIIAKFIFIIFFANKITDAVFVALKSGYDIRNFQFIYFYSYDKSPVSASVHCIKLGDIGIICFNKAAYFAKRIIFSFHFQYYYRARFLCTNKLVAAFISSLSDIAPNNSTVSFTTGTSDKALEDGKF